MTRMRPTCHRTGRRLSVPGGSVLERPYFVSLYADEETEAASRPCWSWPVKCLSDQEGRTKAQILSRLPIKRASSGSVDISTTIRC